MRRPGGSGTEAECISSTIGAGKSWYADVLSYARRGGVKGLKLGSSVEAGEYTRTGVVNNGNVWKQRLTVAEEGPVNENRLVAGVLGPWAVSGGTNQVTGPENRVTHGFPAEAGKWDETEIERKLYPHQPTPEFWRKHREPEWLTIQRELQQHKDLTLQLIWEEYRINRRRRL